MMMQQLLDPKHKNFKDISILKMPVYLEIEKHGTPYKWNFWMKNLKDVIPAS